MSKLSFISYILFCSTSLGSNERYLSQPVPAGISLPIITFSLSPNKWSTLPFNDASVNTLLVSWNEDADKKLSVVSESDYSNIEYVYSRG